MKNNSVGFILTNYVAGSPIGPMLTSRLYLEEILKSGIDGPVLCITPSELNRERLSNEFKFSNDFTIANVNAGLPIPFRILCSFKTIYKIYKIYKNCDYVHIFWYPGIVHLLPTKLIKRSFFTMMDSQVKLILETSDKRNLFGIIKYKFRAFVYLHYEKKIHKNALLVNYVSIDDVPHRDRFSPNVIITKLPTSNKDVEKINIYQKKVAAKILIPRPDLELLSIFISEVNRLEMCEIEILANCEIDSSLQNCSNIKHIKYIENYDDFYAQSGLVVLLDAGGAGTTNRSLTVCRHSLPFIATNAALRGHDFIFENALMVSNDIKLLAETAVKNIRNLELMTSDNLKNYIDSFKADKASVPLISKIKSIIN